MISSGAVAGDKIVKGPVCFKSTGCPRVQLQHRPAQPLRSQLWKVYFGTFKRGESFFEVLLGFLNIEMPLGRVVACGAEPEILPSTKASNPSFHVFPL